ncbi:MAG: PDZ domain-containing protein [Chloroflexi bacterium]|nr:PDZ domain-containing protein [Chloroflexota bacterium]
MKRISWLLMKSLLPLVLLVGCNSVSLPSLDLIQLQTTATAPSAATPEPAVATIVPTATLEPTITTVPTLAPAPTAPPAPLAAANTAASSVTSASVIAALQGTLENIYSQVSPSVVKIDVVENQPAFGRGRFRGSQGTPPQVQGLGSGFVWDQAGNIVTNNHVVANAVSIIVTFADGTSVPATLVGADPDTDLAVVKVDMPAAALQPVQMGDSTIVKVGQLAIAIGNPFGEQGTMTTGIISALSRAVSTSSASQQGPTYTVADLIQTDAPINPGNSGGVLLNADGRVIGVTSAIESTGQSSSGIGFAIPSIMITKVVPALISAGHYDHAWLGISGTSLTPQLTKEMDLPAAQRGALVENVVSASPAGKAGLQAGKGAVTVNSEQVQVGGEVIVAIDGQPVKEWGTLITYLAHHTTTGQTVSLTVLRQGKEEKVQVTLATRPTSPTRTY